MMVMMTAKTASENAAKRSELLLLSVMASLVYREDGWRLEKRMTLLPPAIVADDLENGQNEGKGAGGEASHGDHKGEPTGVGVGTLVADSAEESVNGDYTRKADSEDTEAGAEDFACIRLEKAGWHEIRTCLS